MDLVRTLIERHFGAAGGTLHIGGIPVSCLADRFGTPFYAYDGAIMAAKLALLRDALPREFTIHYSVKANPNPAIIRHFVDAGCGLEVASAGEFRRALDAGCDPDKIVFAGPGKTDRELEYVLTRHIGEIHMESFLEAKRIASVCQRLDLRARVAIRVNPGVEMQGGAMRMGGKPAPFGVDEEILDSILDFVLSEPAMEFRGIHLFTGTQILDHGFLLKQYKEGLRIAKTTATRSKMPLRTVDFGGGFGIPYFEGDRELDLCRLADGLTAMMREVRDDARFFGTSFIVEPGRYLVGEAGVYIARVTDIKVSRGKKFLVLDGGMNHHLAASGNLGQVIKRNFPMAIANKLDRKETEVVDVVGPLCTPLDTLGRSVELAVAEVGDLVAVLQSGAYGLSASPTGFLSHPAPAELWLRDGSASIT